MRNKIYNHPDLKYIINQIKKGVPYAEIERRVNKRAKGESITRHSIANFAKNGMKQLERKTGPVLDKINELKQSDNCAEIAEVYIEEQIIPAHETLDLLLNNAVVYTQTVLEEVKNKERDMKDFKTLIEAIHSINELKSELDSKAPNVLIGENAYEQYILDVDCEETPK